MISSQLSDGDNILASQYNNLRSDAVQTGTILLFVATTAPDGWLLCEGQSLSTTTYATLFAIIGYTFGGSGSSFTLPNAQDKYIIGVSGTKALASTGGGSVTLVTANLPSHTHSMTTDGSHRHQLARDSINTPIDLTVSNAAFGTGQNTEPVTEGQHTIGNTGSGTSFNVDSPYGSMPFIIKYI